MCVRCIALRELSEAQQLYEMAQSEYQSLIDQGRDDLRHELANTRVNFGVCLRQNGELSEAKQIYEVAQSEYQDLVDKGRDNLRPDLANTRVNLGVCLDALCDLSEAKRISEVAQSECLNSFISHSAVMNTCSCMIPSLRQS